MEQAIERWLAQVLIGDRPRPPDAVDAQALVAAALDHGVLGLIHQRLREPAGRSGPMPADLLERIAGAELASVRQSLFLEAETRRILAALDQAGCQSLLLKGSALAWWLYAAPGLRACNDIDLLVAPAQRQAAIKALAGLGYRPQGLPAAGDLCGFEVTLTPQDPQRPRLEVDLHWALSNAPLFAFRFDFETLYAARQRLSGLGPGAYGLGPVHAFLHAAMHRVHGFTLPGAERLKWLYDLHLLGLGFTPADWRQLCALACEHGLAGCCHHGLKTAEGHFGPVAPEEVLAALGHAAAAEPLEPGRMRHRGYVEWMNFRALPGAGQKLRWLGQRLWPGAEYREARYGKGFGRALLGRLRAFVRRLGG